jgi:hypothetical protein
MKENTPNKAYRFIQRLPTRYLSGFFMIISMVLLIIEGAIFPKFIGDPLQVTLISLTFFFGGIAGLPMIIRKEADFVLFAFEGIPAILIGSILLVSGILVASVPLLGKYFSK